jgi:uncharacterized peroxidase-related enzyme
MSHIKLAEGAPGIVSALKAYPYTAEPLGELAERLLVHDMPTFTKAERETVASYVSYLNDCVFCSESHAAVADQHWRRPGLAKEVWQNPSSAPVSDRLRALLAIAAKVQARASSVSKEDVDRALAAGATERDVHDTVLIAAAFCMYNRYVDGLATLTPPRGDRSYEAMGAMLADVGYARAV